MAVISNQCPVCKSTDCTKEPPQAFRLKHIYDRRCKDCHTLWSPACPKWIGATSLIFGLIPILALGGSFWWIGAIYILYGIEVVLGLTGKLRIIERPKGK